jgi:hypothetical protein
MDKELSEQLAWLDERMTVAQAAALIRLDSRRAHAVTLEGGVVCRWRVSPEPTVHMKHGPFVPAPAWEGTWPEAILRTIADLIESAASEDRLVVELRLEGGIQCG